MRIPPELLELAERQHGLIRRTQALKFLNEGRLARFVGPHGRGQIVLPAVYAVFSGQLTQRQRLRAAQLYAGHDALVTAWAACAEYRFRRAADFEIIDVLIRQTQKRQSVSFVRTERTLWLPEPGRIIEGVRFAPVTRALIDASRRTQDIDDVRSLLTEAIQQRRMPIAALQHQLQLAPMAWSARPRAVLNELVAGAEAVSECDLVVALSPSKVLPFVHFNCTLVSLDGAFRMKTDAYVEDAALAAEVQSKEFHLLPEQQEADMQRKTLAGRYGVHVVEFRPSRVRNDPEAVRIDFEQNYLARKAQGISAAAVRLVCRPDCPARRAG